MREENCRTGRATDGDGRVRPRKFQRPLRGRKVTQRMTYCPVASTPFLKELLRITRNRTCFTVTHRDIGNFNMFGLRFGLTYYAL